MDNNELLKNIYAQLTALFNSLNKKGNYRQEIIGDYHKIVKRLGLEFHGLYSWDDFTIPSSAQKTLSLAFDGILTYDGDVVRSKIEQLISVLENLIADKSISGHKVPTIHEVRLQDIKEIKDILAKIDKIKKMLKVFLKRAEENFLIKVLILIGALSAGGSVLYWIIKKIVH